MGVKNYTSAKIMKLQPKCVNRLSPGVTILELPSIIFYLFMAVFDPP